MTYTLAGLELSRAAYDEIAQKLRVAGYDHAFLEDGMIDMTHIGVTPAPGPSDDSEAAARDAADLFEDVPKSFEGGG